MRARAAILIACFLATGLGVYSSDSRVAPLPQVLLKEGLGALPGWQARDERLADEVVASLDLDDYLFRSYSGLDGEATLYIGYYRTQKKVGAAHSPLVCYPGQGWEVSGAEPLKLATGGTRSSVVNASAMTVRRGSRQDFVVYWFQAHERTVGDTFRQKLYSLQNRFLGRPETNAFVRVSVLIRDDDLAGARRTAQAFVAAFYPVFTRYLKSVQLGPRPLRG